MLDDENGIPREDQPVYDVQQFFDVLRVEADGRLVEYVEEILSALPTELPRYLHPLRFAARKRRGSLTEPEVPEADVLEDLQSSAE